MKKTKPSGGDAVVVSMRKPIPKKPFLIGAVIILFLVGSVTAIVLLLRGNPKEVVAVCSTYEEDSILSDAEALFANKAGTTQEDSIERNKQLDELEQRIISTEGYEQDPNCLHIVANRRIIKGDSSGSRQALDQLKERLAANQEGYVMGDYPVFLSAEEMETVVKGLEEQAAQIEANRIDKDMPSRIHEKTD